MKNIYILTTEKPSRLYIGDNQNFVFGFTQTSIQSRNDCFTNQHIYITSDEEIKEGDWYLTSKNTICRCFKKNTKYVFSIEAGSSVRTNCKKIILTTDQDLIKDGVEVINDDFLEWFIKNPSCEVVEVEESNLLNTSRTYLGVDKYKIIIQQEEESKQETPEEAVKRICSNQDINYSGISVTEWIKQNKNMYSEEDMMDYSNYRLLIKKALSPKEWFEQFKNK